jgi:hypothetical protein
MITPTININGSSIDDLIDPRLIAMDHLMDALEALKQTAPNGRDYIGNRDCWEQDRITHFDRLAKLRALREEIMSEAVYIKEQGQ